jgi:ketosteroid isomerase-like protein
MMTDTNTKVLLHYRASDLIHKIEWIIALFSIVITLGCHDPRTESAVLNQQQIEEAIAELRAAYAAFNRGDIDAAVRSFDSHVEWIEHAEFPGGGTYHGIDGAKRYLALSRAGAVHVISEPERFLPAADRIVVFVHARVLPKNSDTWQDIRLADVYTFHHGRITNMRAFADKEDALRWAGIKQLPK